MPNPTVINQPGSPHAPSTIQVLIVEDNPGDVRLTERLLQGAAQNHVHLVHADRLSSAFLHLEAEKIDAMLLDLSLPDVQGLDGMKQIQAAYPHLPVLVLSGAQDESLALKALEHGAQDYLRKGQEDGSSLVRAIRYAIERQRTEDRLSYLAMHDPLTGLANRILLRDRLEQGLERARRRDQLVHVLYLDLDGFKSANDTCGHTLGDHLLRAVAERLCACVRRTDTIARVGGDEFVVVLEATNHAKDIEAVAQKILDTLSRPFEIQDHRIVLTGSIGLAAFPKDGDSADDLLRHADRAMYCAKEAGGHRLWWDAPPDCSSLTTRIDLSQDFRNALACGELVVYYQPQLNLRTNTVSAVEALLRWNHPTAGMLLPSVFLPFAERGGQMLAVERWLLETAANQYQLWKKESVWSFRLCLNLFARQLVSEHLMVEFLELVDRTRICPIDLAVDIPRLSLGGDIERGCVMLALLQRQGIQIALDDVGTASWSLDALRRLPWDVLKIDSSLVKAIALAPDDASMIRMLVRFGADLGRGIVAEGVENLAQLKYLRSVGCDEAMGHFICPPMPAKDMTVWLKNRNRPEALQTA